MKLKWDQRTGKLLVQFVSFVMIVFAKPKVMRQTFSRDVLHLNRRSKIEFL